MYSVLTIVCHTYSCSCSSHGLWTPTSLWHPGTWLHTHSWACTEARNSCGLLRDKEIKGSKTTAGFDTKTTISLCVIQTHTHTRFHILVRASDWHNDVPSPLTPTMTPNHFLSLCLKIQKYQHLVPLMMMFKQGHTHTHTLTGLRSGGYPDIFTGPRVQLAYNWQLCTLLYTHQT